MKLNFDELKQDVLLEEGEHELQIVAAKEMTSQNGTAMLVLDLREAETDGFTRDHVCTEGPGAFRARQLFKALGIEEADAASMEVTELVGMSVNVLIEHETYNDELRARVKKYIA